MLQEFFSNRTWAYLTWTNGKMARKKKGTKNSQKSSIWLMKSIWTVSFILICALKTQTPLEFLSLFDPRTGHKMFFSYLFQILLQLPYWQLHIFTRLLLYSNRQCYPYCHLFFGDVVTREWYTPKLSILCMNILAYEKSHKFLCYPFDHKFEDLHS